MRTDLARYGHAFKDRAVARLQPPQSAALETVALEVGVGAATLQRWREDAQSPIAFRTAKVFLGLLGAVFR